MNESSAALLELSTDDNMETSRAALGNITAQTAQESDSLLAPLGVSLRPVAVRKILIRQNFSDQSSFDKYIAMVISAVPGVKLISRERSGEKFRFYAVIDDTNPKTMEQVFDAEREICARFAGDELDFEVLPGEELECVIPTGAVSLWRSA